jgi:hypothetical protein
MHGLKEKGINVPSIQWVDSVPTKSQLRYFHHDDEQDVIGTIIPALTTLGLKGVEPVYMPGYENSNAVKIKQFELWYAKPAT